MNIKTILLLSVCVTVSSPMITMDLESNNNVRFIQIPNNSNLKNNKLNLNNLKMNNINAGSKGNSMLLLVNELKSSFTKQHSKIKNNVIVSSVLLGGGMISFAVGCAYDMTPFTVLGLMQLTGSAVVGNLTLSHQATQYQFKNDRIYNNLIGVINSLPDIENQVQDTK